MYKFIVILTLLIPMLSHASYKTVAFYAIKTSDYNADNSRENLSKAIIISECYSTTEDLRRIRSGLCTQRVSANDIMLVVDSRGSKGAICQIYNKTDGKHELVFSKNFLDDSDPKNMTTGEYVCAKTVVRASPHPYFTGR